MRQTKSESNLTSVGKNSIRLHHIHESQRRIRRPTTESDCIEVGEDTPKMTNSPHSDFRSETVGTGNAQHKHGCASDCFDVPQEVCLSRQNVGRKLSPKSSNQEGNAKWPVLSSAFERKGEQNLQHVQNFHRPLLWASSTMRGSKELACTIKQSLLRDGQDRSRSVRGTLRLF